MDSYQNRNEQAEKLRQIADAKHREAYLNLQKKDAELANVTGTMRADNDRATKVVENSHAVIQDVHKQFEQATELKGRDVAFLMGAAAIQTARWALLPAVDWDFSKIPASERLTAQEGGKIETEGVIQELEKEGILGAEVKNHEYIRKYTWDKLLIAPVPYDAMHGSRDIVIPGIKDAGVELYSKNHHVATWGHDPVYGWIFGPLNITSRTITFRDFQTYRVKQDGNSFNQIITTQTTPFNMIVNAVDSWSEDSRRLFASVTKQGLHLQSDKYTKTGLPIPFLNEKTAQRLMDQGWNSNEAERLLKKAAKDIGIMGAQYILALLIDQLVKALHLLCYDETKDGSITAYNLKTQKIICYSGVMAETANGIYVASTGNFGKLDIGGYVNLAKNLIQNKKFQEQVKREFLEKELYRRVYGEDYYWEASK